MATVVSEIYSLATPQKMCVGGVAAPLIVSYLELEEGRERYRKKERDREEERERVIPCTNVSSLCMNPWNRTDGVRMPVYDYMDGVWNVVIR